MIWPPPQPEWMAHLKAGDVLTNGRQYRVVRAAHYRTAGHRLLRGRLHSVTFAIRRPSWTGRAYTCLGFVDLIQRGFRPAGVRVKLNREMDARIEKCIHANELRGNYSLTPRDVAGLP